MRQVYCTSCVVVRRGAWTLEVAVALPEHKANARPQPRVAAVVVAERTALVNRAVVALQDIAGQIGVWQCVGEGVAHASSHIMAQGAMGKPARKRRARSIGPRRPGVLDQVVNNRKVRHGVNRRRPRRRAVGVVRAARQRPRAVVASLARARPSRPVSWSSLSILSCRRTRKVSPRASCANRRRSFGGPSRRAECHPARPRQERAALCTAAAPGRNLRSPHNGLRWRRQRICCHR